MSEIHICRLCGFRIVTVDGAEPACNCLAKRKPKKLVPYEVPASPPRKTRLKRVLQNNSVTTGEAPPSPTTPAPSAESRCTPLVGAAAFPRVSPAVISLREYSDLYVLQKLKKKIVSLLRPLPEPYVSERSIGVWPIVRSFVTSLCEQLDISVTRFIDRVIVWQLQKVLDWILPPGWNAVTEFERRQAE